MHRLAALNDASNDEQDGKELTTSKAQVQQLQESEILKRYNEALAEQRKGNFSEAIDAYKQLLETQYLVKAEPVDNSQEVTANGISPIYNRRDLSIKYSCLRNLAEIYSRQRQLSLSLDYFLYALEIDGTDVSTWFRVGVIASKLGLINFAPQAFLRGVACSKENMKCLDRAAVSLVVNDDYVGAMEILISCFKINPDYQRGLALRDFMLEKQPWLKTSMTNWWPEGKCLLERTFNGPEEIREKLRSEIKMLENNFQLWRQREARKAVVYLELLTPLHALTWQCIGEAFLALFRWFEENNESVLERCVNLLSSLPAPQMENATNTGDVISSEKEEPLVIEACGSKDETPADLNNDDGMDDRKTRRRTGSGLMEQLLMSGKRRSARVRTCRKEQESMSVADALTNILPRSLLHKVNISSKCNTADDSMDTMDLYKLFEKQIVPEVVQISTTGGEVVEETDHDKLAAVEGYYGTLQEEHDVRSFLENLDKQPFLEILKGFVFAMEKSWNKTWPKKLISVYIACYQAFRKNYGILPQLLTYKEIRLHTYEESGATLLYHELMIDSDNCGEDILPLQLMHNIVELTCFPEVFPDAISHAVYELRIMWMRAHLFLSRGETSDAILHYESALNCYMDHPELEQIVICLCNCYKSRNISKEIVLAALDAQSRKKVLSEVVTLYNEGSYKEVADTLRDHVNSTVNIGDEVLGRKGQVNMLINTLYHIDEYKECLALLETSIYELLNSQRAKDEDLEKSQEWKVEFDQKLVAMEECCYWGELSIYDALPKNRLPRFVQTLCQAICLQLEDHERPPCASRPWITLNQILVAMEDDELQPAKTGRHDVEDDGSDNDESDIPASVLVLFTAHEYLGRREWCNCDGNVLLLLILDQVTSRLRSPEWSPFRETVQQYIDQVVYCLYAHPSKKNKSRNIVDHNVSPIPLTWDRAMQLFEIYRPDETPAFDSLRVNLISADIEVLFRRIASLIPEEIDPAPFVDDIKDFIYKRRNDLPDTPVKLPPKIADLFYILGDYYFKTHESVRAVTYLLLDLSANSFRVDAWASIALSKVSMLEFTLNSCDPLQNDEFLKEAMAAIRCYEHCMNLDKSICTLLIEYGSFAYTVHAFCSQRMKLESESLSLEQFEEIETTKTKMLEAAKEAFLNANNIWSKSNDEDKQDERWLHYYMLGKIAEKSGDLAYLQYYERASNLLYDNNALYPKKISYNTPQTLAIEAMEIYYRAHVCVIKCLELHDGEPLDDKTRQMFVNFLDTFANGPFAKQLSKPDLIKQKAKEADAAEQANNRELNMIHNLLSDIISDVKRKEEEEKAETRQIVDELLLTIVNESIVNAMRIDKTNTIVKSETKLADSHISHSPCQNSKPIRADEVSTVLVSKENLKVDTNLIIDRQAKSEDRGVPAETIPDEDDDCIVISSDEAEVMDVSKEDLDEEMIRLAANLVPKEELDEEMLRLAANVASEAPEVVPSKSCSVANVMGYVPSVEFASAGLPPTAAHDYMNYYSRPFEPYPHEQLPQDNYYYTLEDLEAKASIAKKRPLKVKKTPCGKKRKRMSREKLSSSSSESEDIAYADESSPGSSSSSSSSSPSSSDESETEITKKRKKSGQRPSRPPKLVQDTPKTDVNPGIQEKQEEIMAEPSPVKMETLPLHPDEALLQQCIKAFELCALRFPQHYKSIYRLAHFFYRSKKHRDLDKCRQLLLGSYPTDLGNITGLFADNKNTNFFNGIWRLPAADVDRPGSFASHMSRSVMLLLEVLRDHRDHKLLLQLCMQLRKVPEPEKKYLREDERLPLSMQALNLSLISLRHTVRHADVMTLPIVLDAYRVYLRVQKHFPSKENAFGDCLREAFNRLGKGESSLKQCLKFCQGELTGNRMEFPSSTLIKPKLKKQGSAKNDAPPKSRLSTLPCHELTDSTKAQEEVKPEPPKIKSDVPVTSSTTVECDTETQSKARCQDRIDSSKSPEGKRLDIKDERAHDVPVNISRTNGCDGDGSKRSSDTHAQLSIESFSQNLIDNLRDESEKASRAHKEEPPFKSTASSVETKKSSLPSIDLTQSVAEVLKLSNESNMADSNSPSENLRPAGPSKGSIVSKQSSASTLDPEPSDSVSVLQPKATASTAKSSTTFNPSHTSQKFMQYAGNPANLSSFPATQPHFGLPSSLGDPSCPTPNDTLYKMNFIANYFAQLQNQMLTENPVLQRKQQQPTTTAPQKSHSVKPSKSASVIKEISSRQSHQPSARPPVPPKPRIPPLPRPPLKPSLSPTIFTPTSSSNFKPQSNLNTHPTVRPDAPASTNVFLDNSISKRNSPSLPVITSAQKETKAKFNIDDILRNNPGISITHKKQSSQSEAINLSAKGGRDGGKRPASDEPQKPPKKVSPEIVILD